MTATAVTCECGGASEVVETRPTETGTRRRRRCTKCDALIEPKEPTT